MATAKKAPAKPKEVAVEQVIETPVVSKKQEPKKNIKYERKTRCSKNM